MMTPTKREIPTQQEISQEREEVRKSLRESLRLIVQSQMVLADLQINQRRLEALLAALDAST